MGYQCLRHYETQTIFLFLGRVFIYVIRHSKYFSTAVDPPSFPLISPLTVPAFFIRSLLKVDYNLSNFMMKGIQQHTHLGIKNTTETPLLIHPNILVYVSGSWSIKQQQQREQWWERVDSHNPLLLQGRVVQCMWCGELIPFGRVWSGEKSR